jgi:two-component system cell cycle response regulator DivK
MMPFRLDDIGIRRCLSSRYPYLRRHVNESRFIGHSRSSKARGKVEGITISSMKLRYYQIRDSWHAGRRTLRRRRVSARAGREAMPKKVMIVEDNELNMKLFRDLIEASGYETVRTRNGLEALDLARTHRPDLILMDIQLPEVSGLEVTKWLKQDDDLHKIPVIAVTAFAMKGDEERIRQGGCEAYISKPISVPRFIETIKSYLGDA